MSSDVTVVTERLPDSQVSLAVDVPQEMVERAYQKALNQLGQKVKIQGFRPGRAPREMVEARVGPAALQEEVIDSLVPGVLGQALRDHGIEPIDRPRLETVNFERGQPGSFTARVSVMPEVAVPDVSQLRVERSSTEVTEDLVEQRLQSLREKEAEIEPVEREVRRGDIVVADLEIEIDGRTVDSETRKGMDAEVAEGVLLPELLEVLPGRQIGEQVAVELEMPDDHINSELAGKKARLRMTIGGLKEKRIPELDDEVAGRLTEGRQQTVEAFRAAVREELEAQARQVDQLAHEQAVLKAVVEGSTLAVPAALVDRQVEEELHDMEHRLARRGLSMEGYLSYLNKTPEQWAAEARPQAEDRLRVELVMGEFARQHGIEPTGQEVLAHLAEEAERDEELRDRVEELKKSDAARGHFRNRLRKQRTLERMVELASGAAPSSPSPAPIPNSPATGEESKES